MEENLERWWYALGKRGIKVTECGKEVKKCVQAGWNGWRSDRCDV